MKHDPELLRKLLRYDPETGRLFWMKRKPDILKPWRDVTEDNCRRWNTQYEGKEAFNAVVKGYKMGCVFYAMLPAHRVAWAIVHGKWPKNEIDHINHDRSDNRLINLRAVTRQENLKNTSMFSHNTSGFNGVSWNKTRRRFKAYIKVERKLKELGYFEKIEDAIAARKAANVKYGFHENHGRQVNDK